MSGGAKTLDMERGRKRYPSAEETEAAKKAAPPVMQRSRAQIATSYAPGVLMTWEGGRGICKSVPIKDSSCSCLFS